MKLDRNINGTGRGKYGLVNHRRLFEVISPVREFADGNEASMIKLRLAMKVRSAIKLLEDAGIIDWGDEGTASEFFVIKLRDENASHALEAYANMARIDDEELGADVQELAMRAGSHSPFCKKPD